MKYCLNYKKHSTKIDEIDEILIYYNSGIIAETLDFMLQHPDKRFILDMADYTNELNLKEIQKIETISKENNLSITLRFPELNDKIKEQLSQISIKFFINMLVSRWDTLVGLLELGVSDIYIVEELGFELDKVSKLAHKYRANVRVFPNVCQTCWKTENSLKTFFIRPEDIEIYEDYVDVIEFFGELKRQEALLDIYKNKKRYFGSLKEIIIGMNEDIDSRYLVPTFPKRRISCAKDCIKGGKCELCDHMIQIGETLKKSNLVIIKKKKGLEDGERTSK